MPKILYLIKYKFTYLGTKSWPGLIFSLNFFGLLKIRQRFAKMKLFRLARIKKARQGFSLVEAAFSLGILSFGFLSLAPLVGLGLTSARQARDGQLSAQIATTIAEQAREGALTNGSGYCDNQGAVCASSIACYQTQTTESTVAGNCTRLTIQVAPIGNPHHAQSYAVVLPPQ